MFSVGRAFAYVVVFYHLLLYREEKWLRHVAMVAVSLYLNRGPGNMAEKKLTCTVEPQFNERLCNDVNGITNDILRPSNRKIQLFRGRFFG